MRTDDRRVLGLSRRARHVVAPAVLVAVAVILVGQLVRSARGEETADEGLGPRVGGDLHAIAELEGRVFVGGHGGAGSWAAGTGWSQIPTLDDRDVMGWAGAERRIFAGGHAGLYVSEDGGRTFSPDDDFEGVDVHAVGGLGRRVYLASPSGGVFVSTDAGRTFVARSQAGTAFMGSIWVDPRDPDVAIAPSMQDGVVRTTDGGRSWTSLGGPPGVMSVSADASGETMVAVGMGGAQQSTDAGASWTTLALPRATAAAAYTANGDLLSAALTSDRASVSRQEGDDWVAVR